VNVAAGKPRTEAAQIITRLQFSGMKRAEIAKQIGVSAATVNDIARGKSSGNDHLLKLRSLHTFTPSQTPASSPAAADSAPSAADNPTQAISPAVDVQEAPKEPERTIGQKIGDGLKDAILGKGPSPLVSSKQAKGGGAGASNDELVEQLVPTLALALVIAAHAMTPVRYAAVDPTHAEAAAMLTPIVRIMTRQMDAAGKLTETQMDLLQCVMACGMYGQRAFMTYREIRASEGSGGNAEHDGSAQSAQANYARRDTRQPSQPPRSPDATQRGFMAATAQAPASISGNGANGGRATAEHPGQNEVGKSNPFAELYQLDAIGRRQLGI
jgi:transcriptional regulator with XRE-family HTH domain